jgi:tetratricopeptide (TPR) repeat protein
MSSRYPRSGRLQVGLALSALVYLASLWLFPQWDPIYGLLLLVGLAAVSGLHTFISSLRDSGPELRAGQPVASLPVYPNSEPPKKTDILPEPRTAIAEPEDEQRRHLREQVAGLRTARRAGDGSAEAACLLELSNAYRHSGEPRRASFYYQQCLRVARQFGDQRSEATALGNLGLTHADLGQLEQAVDYYEQQLLLVRAIGDRPAEARASWNSGLAYQELGNLETAAAAMQVCVDFERAAGHPDAEPDAALVEELRARLVTGRQTRSESPQLPGR